MAVDIHANVGWNTVAGVRWTEDMIETAELLERENRPMGPHEISELLKMPFDACRARLSRMAGYGLIRLVGTGDNPNGQGRPVNIYAHNGWRFDQNTNGYHPEVESTENRPSIPSPTLGDIPVHALLDILYTAIEVLQDHANAQQG